MKYFDIITQFQSKKQQLPEFPHISEVEKQNYAKPISSQLNTTINKEQDQAKKQNGLSEYNDYFNLSNSLFRKNNINQNIKGIQVDLGIQPNWHDQFKNISYIKIMELNLNLNKLEIPKSKLSKSLSSKNLSLSARESLPQNDQAAQNNSPKNVKVKIKKIKKIESLKYPNSKNAPQNPFLQRIKAQLFSINENQNISTHDAEQPLSGSIKEIKEQKQQIQKSNSSEQLVKIISAKQLDGIQKSKFALGTLKKSGIISKRSKK